VEPALDIAKPAWTPSPTNAGARNTSHSSPNRRQRLKNLDPSPLHRFTVVFSSGAAAAAAAALDNLNALRHAVDDAPVEFCGVVTREANLLGQIVGQDVHEAAVAVLVEEGRVGELGVLVGGGQGGGAARSLGAGGGVGDGEVEV